MSAALPTLAPPRRKYLVRIVIGAPAIYVLVTLIFMALENRLLFHPVRASERWIDPPAGCRFEDVELHTRDGTKVHGRWIPCDGANGAVLICHSRAGNLSLALPPDQVQEWQREIGQSVFVFDYPGYGRSDGAPSEAGCYAAADAAYEWLTQNRPVRAEDIVIVGRSLGAAVAVDLASRKPHRALVLISPFTSFPDVAQHDYPFLPARWLAHNQFNSLAKIGACRRPVLIVHGMRDHTVPFAQGERLFKAANEPKRMVRVEGANHGDAVLAGFFGELHRFLAGTVAEEPD
jgi:pimeloyl-ACP methyl ester carboxylesterase